MLKLRERVFFILLILIGLASAYSLPSFAQTTAPTTGINISPPLFSNVVVDPGKVIQNTIRVTNVSERSVNVQMLIRNFVAAGETGGVQLEDPSINTPYSLASWITVTPSSFSLSARQTMYVSFVIHVPANAEPGGRYASIVASVSSPYQNIGSGSSVGTEIGSLILLTVAGKADINASLLTFTSPGITTKSTVNFVERIEDTGNIHIHPTGDIVISNIFGTKVDTLELQSIDVLPGAVRRIQQKLSTDALFGYYNAAIVVNYGGSTSLTESTSFFVIPVWQSIAVLVVIIVLLLLRKNILRASKAFINK